MFSTIESKVFYKDNTAGMRLELRVADELLEHSKLPDRWEFLQSVWREEARYALDSEGLHRCSATIGSETWHFEMRRQDLRDQITINIRAVDGS